MTLPRLLLFLSLPLYALDQVTKMWTVKNFPLPGSPEYFDKPIIEDVFHWVRVHNQGVAFGMGNHTAWAPIVFLFVPVVALTMIRIFWKKGVFASALSKIAVALLLCGIFGNLTDRLVQGSLLEEFHDAGLWTRLTQGYVVDFIAIKLPIYGWWPAFNVADSCICVAACLLFISGLRDERKAKSQPAPSAK